MLASMMEAQEIKNKYDPEPPREVSKDEPIVYARPDLTYYEPVPPKVPVSNVPQNGMCPDNCMDCQG